MINSELTFDKFGYLPESLSEGSNKKVIAVCHICCNPRVIQKYAYRDNCGRCARLLIIKALIEVSAKARLGKSRSLETRLKQSIAHLGGLNPNYGKKANAETRKKLSEAQKGENNGFYGKKHTEETKKRMSEIRTANPTHLGKHAAHGKGQYYVCKDNSKVWMRSSWEIKVAEYLDLCGFNWEYEEAKFQITYAHKGQNKIGTYISDFKVWSNNFNEYEIWEVKGYWRDDAETKYKAFRDQYPNIICKLLTRKELRELGLKGIK